MVVEKSYIEPVAVKAYVKDRVIFIELHDDRCFSFPAHKFSRLKEAPDDLLKEVRIRAQGSALRWEKLDEDFRVARVVQGIFEQD